MVLGIRKIKVPFINNQRDFKWRYQKLLNRIANKMQYKVNHQQVEAPDHLVSLKIY